MAVFEWFVEGLLMIEDSPCTIALNIFVVLGLVIDAPFPFGQLVGDNILIKGLLGLL